MKKIQRRQVNAILSGSYTEKGIVCWWARPRRELAGLSPVEAWSQGDRVPVLDLAIAAIGMVAS